MNYKNILEESGLSVTKARLLVLQFFHDSNRACSMATLLKEIKGSNRITLYRTLKQFVDKNILISIPGNNNLPIYCITNRINSRCKHKCQVIFVCNTCKSVMTKEVDYLTIDHLFSNIQIEKERLLVQGCCNECLNKSNI